MKPVASEGSAIDPEHESGRPVDANPSEWEEYGLRDAVLRGDEAAWRVLYERCFDRLYARVRYRTGGHVQRTEEVVQECWMTAVRQIRKFDPARGSFEAWLNGIAENVLRNRRRRWARRDRTEVPAGERAADIPNSGTPPDGGLAELVAVVMAGLHARYRAVLEAKYANGLAVAEIANQWGESTKAVESLLSRARAAFRAEFSRLENEYGQPDCPP